eukprot:scaffold2331_cov50-Skeletonema_dohrnii-CCMP3373.AAC.1
MLSSKFAHDFTKDMRQSSHIILNLSVNDMTSEVAQEPFEYINSSSPRTFRASSVRRKSVRFALGSLPPALSIEAGRLCLR